MYFVLILSFFIFIVVVASRLLFSLFALTLGAQPLTVGALAATFSLFPTLLSVTAGKFADRFGARRPLEIGSAAMALGMLIPYAMPGIPALFVAAAIIGLATTFFVILLQNLIGGMSDASTRARNFSNFAMVGSAVNLAGPVCVGFSVDMSGHALACLYLALVSVVPIVMLAIRGGGLPGATVSDKPRSGSILRSMPAGLWRILAICGVLVAGIDLFQFYMPIYGHELGMSASAIGVILGTFSAAGFVVRLILMKLIDWLSVETVLAYSFFLGTACCILVPFCTTFEVLVVLAFVFGFSVGCGQPITMMLTYNSAGGSRPAEALGLRMTVNHLSRVVGPVLFGSIGSALGLFAVFWINAALMSVGGVLSRGAKKRGAA